MNAYYNEIDPYAAQWLRNLIDRGLIAAGDVDERSIVDVRSDDLRGYTQCHFFAGIAGWSYALRLAGWTDDRPVWTGSCPCQPFSTARKGQAADDERHLWPAWFSLIHECKPAIVFGEQVDDAIGWGWLDLVCSQMEAEGYAIGATVLPASSVQAPHIRDRVWFVAVTDRLSNGRAAGPREAGGGRPHGYIAGSGFVGELANAEGRDQRRHGGESRSETIASSGQARQANGNAAGSSSAMGELADASDIRCGGSRGRESRSEEEKGRLLESSGNCSYGELADANGGHASAEGIQRSGEQRQQQEDGRSVRVDHASGAGLPKRERYGRIQWEAVGSSAGQAVVGAGNPWDDIEWIPCTDGKARPVESGTFPLVAGLSEKLGRLRAVEDRAFGEIVNGQAQTDAGEKLRMVREGFRAQASRKGCAARMCVQFHATEILLDLLFCRASTCDGTADNSRLSETRNEARRRVVRVMRSGSGACCASCRLRPDEQQIVEPANPMHVLPFVLARHAQAFWNAAAEANASDSRAGRLRAYGNSIVPQVAAAFIGAAMEAAA